MYAYKGLAGLFMTFAVAAADVYIPDGASLCVGQGEGSCQFGVYSYLNSKEYCSATGKRQAIIFDHACNQIGHSDDNFALGASIDSQLPYTVDVIHVTGAQDSGCNEEYTITYSDGEYGYGEPSGGVWGQCTSNDSDYPECNYYRVAFACPGF
ncbi:hypothetical protein N7478_013114 [Penicillium angulare]|uniref:uncharacterized protein n=1 Tax=Penicillium angulare TaxID=116970 RepID=UPI002540C0BF|nr:uncharacterized protein N7478_013114 [Penicillium angulare]KAJ5257010.1 hypothetical protein N7478_013114 [Penicillium angulare]